MNPIYLSPHFPECEDLTFKGYHCKRCNRLIEVGLPSRNWCDYCGFFAGKPTECICDLLEHKGGI